MTTAETIPIITKLNTITIIMVPLSQEKSVVSFIIVEFDFPNIYFLTNKFYDNYHNYLFYCKNLDFNSAVGTKQLSFLPYHLYRFLAM